MTLTDELRSRLNQQLAVESMADIARATGVDLAIVFKFATADRKHIRQETADAIAEHLGFSGIKWRRVSVSHRRKSKAE